MMTKSPAEYARWVRQVHGIPDEGPLRIEQLVGSCGGRIDEAKLKSCAGTLVPLSDTFGILVRDSDSPVRQRFTVAHELGHFCIPSHSKRAAYCVSPELAVDGSAKSAEREASAFAAELLMPRKRVEPMVASGAIDVALALTVVEAFEVSRVAAALRVCEVTRERAAVVYSRDGRIKWSYRFGMPFGLVPNGDPPPGASVAHDIMSGSDGSVTAQVVDAGGWLPLSKPDLSWCDLLESSIRLEDSNDIITVLWLTLRA